MPKVSPLKSNFNAGELSPLMLGRVDFDVYKNGMLSSVNLIPYIQGGITRRPGTYFADEVKDSTKKTRAVDFKFSTTQAYIIEFGDLYIRFKRNNGPVTETGLVITGITQANPGVLTYTGTDPSNGDHMDLAGIVGMSELNLLRVTVANVDTGANTFELSGVDTSSLTAYTSGGTASRVYEIVSTYLEADLFDLKFTQSIDVLYIMHPSYKTRKLTRTAHTAWTLREIDFKDGPYLPTNSGTTTITPSGTTGSITLTASASLWVSTDVGRLVRIKHGSTWGYAKITSYTSDLIVNADVKSDFGATTAQAAWRLGLWSDTTGYPSCATFFEDRLCFGGNTNTEQRLDASRTGDYENFAPTDIDGTVVADHAISVTLSSDDVQVIRWMKGTDRSLLIGTVEGEWEVRPSTQGEALTATNIAAKQPGSRGSYNAQAIRAGDAILFIQKAKRKLRELAYVFESDKFKSPDMTVISEHITRSGLEEVAYQKEPQSIVWGRRTDGVLLGFTYERDQKVLGWHSHTLGGFSDAAKTKAPVVESLATIPAADGSRDELWGVVKRYINGGTKRYFEYLSKMWENGDDQKDAFHVDCGLTYDDAAATTISGLHHLVGETLECLVDGAAHPDVTVNSIGQVTLNSSASVVHLGYGYKSDGRALRPEAGAADGTAQMKTQRTHRVGLRLLDTLGLSIGPDFDNLTPIVFRKFSDLADQAVPLFTGDISEPWEGDYTMENIISFRFDQPFPGTILAIGQQLHTQDR